MKFLYCFLIVYAAVLHQLSAQNYADQYLEEWKKFYPSRALALGINNAVFSFEDFSQDNITGWLAYNQKMLSVTDSALKFNRADRINLRLLRTQLRTEIDKWEVEKPHSSSLTVYSSLIANSTKRVVESDFLLASEKSNLICQRFEEVQRLCNSARASLKEATQADLERGLQQLESAQKYFREGFSREQTNLHQVLCNGFNEKARNTADHIQKLIDHVKRDIQPGARKTEPVLGRKEYARKLSLYVDGTLTPEQLADIALKEIDYVRGLMEEVAKAYFKSTYPDRKLPKTFSELMQVTLEDMEADAPKNGAEYLEFWNALTASSVAFLDEKKIATLPKNTTLQILTAPESAGPAARIGWVSSAPPFSPNPMTTLYVPSIPDDYPEKERREFWASFNKPFNRMIVIHELYPGHYMQNKIARESPHAIRLVFPFGIYSEGWATFCERVALDAGWEAHRPLTLLAHFRKRLENANRAYTSVMVHCNGWDKEKTISFSIEKCLLAPQFAKSLWGRLMDSPMQMTSYFLGMTQFNMLFAHEKNRLGSAFNLQQFMDTILRAGPIPIDEFYSLFDPAHPGSK